MLFEIIEIGYNVGNLMFIRGICSLIVVFVTGASAYIPSRNSRLERLRVHV